MSVPMRRQDANKSREKLTQNSPAGPIDETQKPQIDRLELRARLLKTQASSLLGSHDTAHKQSWHRPASLLFQLNGKWPQLRNGTWDRGHAVTGRHGQHFLIPGVINLAEMLNSTVWKGMPSLDAPPMRTRPANCADIIVSILYRHDPKTLREFFGKEHFVYAHFSTDPEDRRGPFVIVRARQRVEAGFPIPIEPITSSGDVSTTGEWRKKVCYTLLKLGTWRAKSCSTKPSKYDEEAIDATWTLTEQDEVLQRANFEKFAVDKLSLAVEQRRWKTQKGEQIMVDSFSEAWSVDMAPEY